MRSLCAALFAAASIALATAATADDRPSGVLDGTVGHVVVDKDSDKGGLGYSALVNVTRLYADGRYDILAAGVGFGASWKSASPRYPLEIGLYLAPQFAKSVQGVSGSGSIATLLHFTFFKAFGLGAGFDAWGSDGGFTRAGVGPGSRLFVTLGYGVTNETQDK